MKGKIKALFLMCTWFIIILLIKACLSFYPMNELWIDYWDAVIDNWRE